MRNNIRQKLKRIRMELAVLNSDLSELEDTGFVSNHLSKAIECVHMAISELSTGNIESDVRAN